MPSHHRHERPVTDAGPGMSAPLEASITRVGSVDAVERVWRELEARGAPHFFLSWTWIGSWLRLVVPATRVWLFECRKEGRAVGAALLTLHRGHRLKGRMPIRQLHLNEYPAAGFNMVMAYNGLLTEAGLENEVWAELVTTAETLEERWDELFLSSLASKNASAAVQARSGLGIRHEKTFVHWMLDIDADCAETDRLLARLKRKSRQQMRQSLKAYERLGELRLDVAASPDEAHRMFDQLEELHTVRWEAAGLPGSFGNPRWVAFHRDVIDRGFPYDQIRLLRITCAGRPIGVLYGHQYGDTVYMHQTGFEVTEDNALRPGYVCHFEAIRHFAANGVRHYDLLPDAQESYKKFFTDPGEPVHWLELQHHRLRFTAERFLRSVLRGEPPRTGS